MEPHSDLLKRRLEKLALFRDKKLDPFPHQFAVSHLSADIRQNAAHLIASGQQVQIAGRLVAVREHGSSCFGHLQDSAGKIQIYLRRDDLGVENFALFGLLDIGDIVGAWGTIFETRTGEVTVRLHGWSLLAKSLRALPEKWHGLKDKEIRYRQRYVDLIANEEVRQVFQLRAVIIREVRRFLDDRGFLEVETPILQPLYGGAFAQPFVTRHQALGMKLYLRIADELYLKRLIVGGFDRVYELSKNFRNEGIDRSHIPEFTFLELYQAYADYRDIMDLAEALIVQVAQKARGRLQIQFGDRPIDLTPPWRRIPYFQALAEQVGQDISGWEETRLRELMAQHGLEERPGGGRGRMWESLFDALVEPHLVEPTVVVDYPVEISPLAKRHRQQEGLVERFEIFIAGMELANAFTELNDPLDQRQRFQEQASRRRAGDDEAQILDEDFLRALEYGMPPTGGLGMGVDRLVMLLANISSIRDVILFPQLRPEHV